MLQYLIQFQIFTYNILRNQRTNFMITTLIPKIYTTLMYECECEYNMNKTFNNFMYFILC
jgi:hypothetical protein